MKYIRYAVHDRLAYITLNRPEKSNALCYELVSELLAAFKAAEDDEDVKLVILNANGPEGKCGYLRGNGNRR